MCRSLQFEGKLTDEAAMRKKKLSQCGLSYNWKSA
jgi:hypothetical protein